MHGGRYGNRGYYLQALICVMESVKNNSWHSLDIEPDEEKVDIIIHYKNNQRKAIQVKSTKNNFNEGQIKKVLEDTINSNPSADHYQIVLIGDCNEDAVNFIENDKYKTDLSINPEIDVTTKIINIERHQLEIESLKIKVQEHLNDYLKRLGYKIDSFPLGILNGSLLEDTFFSSTDQGKRPIYIKELESKLIHFCEMLNNYKESKPKYLIKYLIRAIYLALFIFFVIPLVSDFISMSVLDYISIPIALLFFASYWLIYKISDNKHRKELKEDIEAYKANTNEVGNNIIKLNVIDKVKYEHGKKQVSSLVELHNISQNNIDYIEGCLHFYYGNTKLYSKDIYHNNIKSQETDVLYHGNLNPNNTRQYWTSFNFVINELKFGESTYSNIELKSESIFRTYQAILNSNYNTILGRLFKYESTWAIDKLNYVKNKLNYYKTNLSYGKLLFKGISLVASILILITLIGTVKFLIILLKFYFSF